MCFFVTKSSNAQYGYINYSVNAGLPSPETYFLHEDVDGYIQICTDRGLARYNGYEFESFDTQDGLSYNIVFKIFEDREQNLWITGFDGSITIYDFKKKELRPFNKNDFLTSLGTRWIECIGFKKNYADFFFKFPEKN